MNAPAMTPEQTVIAELTKERMELIEWKARLEISLALMNLAALWSRAAIEDLLLLYDRAAGNVHIDSGYTAADVRRLAEIRALVSKIDLGKDPNGDQVQADISHESVARTPDAIPDQGK
jgi:hypothetical protein